MQQSAADHELPRFVVRHALDIEDEPITAAMRAMTSAVKGVRQGIESRPQFDALMERVIPHANVSFEADSIGGIPGYWVHPGNWRYGEAILHLHGGWFNFGSAKAYRNLVGHIASIAQARAFIPDYRLAPEHPFPAAGDDVLVCYQGLVERGIDRVALTGDSAGGNLALALASRLASDTAQIHRTLVGVAVLSPVTDLTLSGASYESRAQADPLFTRPQVAELVRSYLGVADSAHPLASPLLGPVASLPSVRIHVGDDEVLLDDSLRYVERAVAADVDARVDVWMGMPHGFVSGIGKLKAASSALNALGDYLAGCLRPHAPTEL